MPEKARFYISVDPGVRTGMSVIRVHHKRLMVLARRTLSMEAVQQGGFHRCFNEWVNEFPITRVAIEEFTLIRKVRKTERQRVAWEHAFSVQQEAIGLASLHHLRSFLIKPDNTGFITTRHRRAISRHVSGSLGRFSKHVIDTIVFVMKVEGIFETAQLNAKVTEESTLQEMAWEESYLHGDAAGALIEPVKGRLHVHTSPFGQSSTLQKLLINQGDKAFTGHVAVLAA